jgi:lipopolysaccharide transport protein LptA
MKSRWIAFLAGAGLVAGASWDSGRAQDFMGTEMEQGEGVTIITSERLTFDYKKNYAVFERDVKVIDQGMTITTDKLAVWFDEDGDIKLIKAEGSVVITQEDKLATSGEATYDVPTGKILLQRSPRLQRGAHYLEGTTITYWRNEELLIVEPQSRLVIYPDEDANRRTNLLGE